MRGIVDYYELLRVTPEASQEEIKASYHAIAHETHPDRVGGAGMDFVRLSKAYAVLTSPAKKKAYDQQLDEIRAANEMRVEAPAPVSNAPQPSELGPVHTGQVNRGVQEAEALVYDQGMYEGMGEDDKHKVRKVMAALMGEVFDRVGYAQHDIDLNPLLLSLVKQNVNDKGMMLTEAQGRLSQMLSSNVTNQLNNGSGSTVMNLMGDYESQIREDVDKIQEYIRLQTVIMVELEGQVTSL